MSCAWPPNLCFLNSVLAVLCDRRVVTHFGFPTSRPYLTLAVTFGPGNAPLGGMPRKYRSDTESIRLAAVEVMMVEKIDIYALLAKNPNAKKEFEEFEEAVKSRPHSAKQGGKVGLPYGGRFLRPDDRQEPVPRHQSYARGLCCCPR